MTSLATIPLVSLNLRQERAYPHLPATEHNITVSPDRNCRLVFLTEPTGLAVEQYKLLRRRLSSKHSDGGLLIITGSSPSEGKTLTATNLAWCLAEGGQSTCLVDLDFRAPCIGTTLGYTFDENGLEDVLRGTRSLASSICRVGDRPLSVLGIRQRVSLPAPLLSPDRLAPLLAQLRSKFKWVLLDMPPAAPMADVAEVLPHVDGALLIVRSDQTAKSSIAGPIEIIGSKLWGVVLNDCPIQGSSYYGSYGVPIR